MASEQIQPRFVGYFNVPLGAACGPAGALRRTVACVGSLRR